MGKSSFSRSWAPIDKESDEESINDDEFAEYKPENKEFEDSPRL
jgi:hypothetical protein